jgi:hypothetical protein
VFTCLYAILHFLPWLVGWLLAAAVSTALIEEHQYALQNLVEEQRSVLHFSVFGIY